ncbi:uncharacterized protein AAGF69_003668 [Amazona ochrocephala]
MEPVAALTRLFSITQVDPEVPAKELAGVLLPSADRHSAEAVSLAEQHSKGVLPAAGAQEEDYVSWSDSESDPETPEKESAGVQLPDAGGHAATTRSLTEQHSNGVLPAARAEKDFVSLLEPVVDPEVPAKELAGVLLPSADRHSAEAVSLAEQHSKGVLPAAGAQEEDYVSWSDSESDPETPEKESAGVQLPNAGGHAATTRSLTEQHSNGILPVAVAGKKEDPDFFSRNEFSILDGEQLQLKKHASTQTCCPGEKEVIVLGTDANNQERACQLKRWVRQLQQALANVLRKNSLAKAFLEAKKRYSQDLQKHKLQKELDRSKAKLQELKEQCIQTECYAKCLKNTIKNKDRELTAFRVLQGLLASSSGTVAIPELEERIQRLQAGKARLEATVQQQAKATEAPQKDLQASALRWSERKEVQKLAQLKHRSEALLDKIQRQNIALEKEYARLKMLLEKSEKADGIRGQSLLSFPGEM